MDSYKQAMHVANLLALLSFLHVCDYKCTSARGELHASQIEERGHTVGADKDILGLHVPVNDPVSVQVPQRFHQLPRNRAHLLLRQLAVILQHLKQLACTECMRFSVSSSMTLQTYLQPHHISALPSTRSEEHLRKAGSVTY